MVPCNKDADTYFDKVLESALHHGRREKRREMIYILGELRDSRALNTLKAIMAEDDPYLVWEAVAAAAKIGGPAAIEQLQIMMRHPSFMVRGEVALALGKMDHPTRDEILNQLRAEIAGEEQWPREKVKKIYQELTEPLIREAREAIRQGIIRNIDPDLIAYAFTGLIDVLSMRITLDNKYTINDVTVFLEDFVLKGLKPVET